MSLRSGLAAQIGFAAETTWGTGVTPDHFPEFVSENINLDMAFIESKAIRSGNRVLRTDRVAQNRKGAKGEVNFEVSSKAFGLLFKHMLGSIATSTPPGGTLSKKHSATLGDPFGLGLTFEVGRPDVGGVVRSFRYYGGKVDSWTLSNAVDGILMLKLNMDFQQEDTSQALAVASYPTGVELLHFGEGVLNLGGTQVGSVKDITINGVVGHKTDRYFIRASTLKKEPIVGAFYQISGDFTMELEDLTVYNRFANNTVGQLDVTWTGVTALEGSIFPYVKVTLNNVQLRGETPDVKGPEILELKVPFTCLYDGTNGPITIDYVTLDATP